MSARRISYIFAYGTLMSSADGSMGATERALMRRRATYVGTARLRAAMYDAGACPGVIRLDAGRNFVWGEVWQLPSECSELLHALDFYEGCTSDSPLPHSYARRKIKVRLPDGRRVAAWIYLWIRSTEGLPRILDGRWRGPTRETDEFRHTRLAERGAAA